MTAWSGARPAVSGRTAADGADPATGRVATSTASCSRSPLPEGAPATFRDPFAEPGPGASGSRAGSRSRPPPGPTRWPRPRAPCTPRPRPSGRRGIAFWIDTGDGDRIGYGASASPTRAGIGEGAPVAAGRPPGRRHRAPADRVDPRRRRGSTPTPCSRPPDPSGLTESHRRPAPPRRLAPLTATEAERERGCAEGDRRSGGPHASTRADDPAPGPGEVVVALRAAALNRRDVFVRKGIAPSPLPVIPGSDGAGVVRAVGAGVSGIAEGDEVIVFPSLGWGGGEEAPAPGFRILGGPRRRHLRRAGAAPGRERAPEARAALVGGGGGAPARRPHRLPGAREPGPDPPRRDASSSSASAAAWPRSPCTSPAPPAAG